MKSYYTFLFSLLISIQCLAQEPFITLWSTTRGGSTCNSCITIPTIGNGYNYDVDWDNDGRFDEFGLTESIVHDFGQPGTYRVGIRGDFPRIYFNGIGDARKLINIIQWGDIKWAGMENAFAGCIYLRSDGPDQPDLSEARSLSYCFANCWSFNGYINDWDVSNITDMSGMFFDANNFNRPLGDWDVSNVTDMSYMFFFNDGGYWKLENWDVSNVLYMDHMFRDADFFNDDISNWNVLNLRSAKYMFYYARSFNQSLGDWKIPSLMAAEEMLSYSSLSCENYSKTLSGWALSIFTPNHLTIDARDLTYSEAVVGSRNTLLDKNWSIYGDRLGDCIVSTENYQIEPVKIFPNPTSDYLYIHSKFDFTWQLWDSFGNKVMSGSRTNNLDLSGLNSGIYFIELFSKNGEIQIKESVIKI